MSKALDLARKAGENGEVPVGAVVVKGGKIIGEGFNSSETDNSILSHAEIIAIKKAEEALGERTLDGCEIYVTLEPCPMCAGAIINARIKTVVFGAFEKNTGSFDSVVNLSALPFPNTPEIFAGIREKECASLLTEFFGAQRKKRLTAE